ncbi:NeuD/PglB/VioB family sugar acetyltransferase [Methylocapsa palsarum]|uniref:Sugar O-acyltransferase, sialic acid O-acetyltransferase NeuD family n=1 Tax=Methylocapsa palsarum TaxID=1612308 RepID=A0A1I4C746_9HYPH|nr:NeuD/PglB/VioB family sugar acetyltransferase [Methylocapsa palsarum]SFK76932.1 sugar O-acyltransferase, sialic acid O-acetyltransferase NeuD family [Methylocapsa palsarum]
MASRDPRPLLIFPCNGNGLEALDCLGEDYRCIGFVDDTLTKQGTSTYGVPVFGRGAFEDFPDASVLAVPGSPTSFRARRQVIAGLNVKDGRFARIIHPSAKIAPQATIGRNVLIMAGVVLTSNCAIGDHVCILPNTVIHHDSTVGDWSLIGSNVTIAGGVTIGENCYIGSGCSIMNNLNLGAGAMLGLGSNLISNVAPGATLVGNPARAIR